MIFLSCSTGNLFKPRGCRSNGTCGSDSFNKLKIPG
jgi:hypothetical protein